MSGCLFRTRTQSKRTTASRRSYGLFCACGFVCYTKKIPQKDMISEIGEKDRISQLPDDILVSIIERLPIKSAIRTSILSNRWRNLHKSVRNINLNCKDLLGYRPDRYNIVSELFDSLDKLLRLRSGSKIHSFRLFWGLGESDSNRFEQCIYSLGKTGIEKLDLAFVRHWDPNGHICFPSHTLPKLTSLKYLKLTQCKLDPGLKRQCNSLKILSLFQVTLLPGAIECILPKCSNLQTLKLRSCSPPSKIRFEGPRLRNLAVLTCLGVNCDEVKEIELYAPNLVVLEVANYSEIDIIFGHVPQLQSVTLDISAQSRIVPCVARKLLTEVPHLKSLSLITSNCRIFEGRPRGTLPMEIINMVSNLTRLDFGVRFTTEETDLVSMTTPLLQCCPLLQEFNLNVLVRWEDPRPRGKKEATVVYPELKKVEISGFIGIESDIEFALYILKSAPSLEDMYISRCSKIYKDGCISWGGRRPSKTPWSEEVLRMIEKRLQGQAVSKTARVIIQHNHCVDNHGGIDKEDDQDIRF